MARSRPSKADRDPTDLSELHAAVDRLTQYVQVLTNSVDELTREIQWHNRQFDESLPSPHRVVLTSMPLDPTAHDWELNRVTADDLPVESPESPVRAQQPLFS
jgi:hypothetical protein